MQITLNELKLKDFKGLDNFKLSPGGKNASVYGDNATGKTTLFDAWAWLLFGKDSLNSAAFDIKKLDATGDPAHNLEHTVSSEIIADGKKSTLKKVYAEKWTKKRGKATAEFSGHTVDHFLDGVPVKEKEFKSRIDSLCPENIFRVICNPRHFADVLHWNDRRRMLLDMCGDITDADVIAGNEDLAGLAEILGEHSSDDYKKIVKARMPEVNRELLKIPTRIDEIKTGLPEITGSPDKIKAELSDLEASKNKILARIQEAKNGGNVAALTVELRTLEADREKLLNDFSAAKRREVEANNRRRDALEQATRDADRAVVTLKDGIESLNRSIGDLESAIKTKDAEIQAARDEWTAENALVFANSTTCPTCGQSLPCEQVESARERFNSTKADCLKSINEIGKGLKARRDEYAARMESMGKEINWVKIQLAAAEQKKADAVAAFEKFAPASTVDRPKLLDGIELQIDALKKQIDENKPDTSALDENVRNIDASISLLNRKLADHETVRRSMSRIEALAKEEKDLAAEYEELERQLFLIDEFTRAKVRMLESRINGKFKLVSFRLFSENINGGLEERCDVVVNGVPWGSLNNAARINGGLDICQTMAAHHGVTVPIWIDNAESVTDIFKTEAQQIRLFVSEPDKTLRIS